MSSLSKGTLSFLEFGVWDFPGPVDYHDPEYVPSRIFAQSGALIYVIDAQDDYVDALANLHSTITQAHRVNPNLLFEVFIHKVDGLSDDYKIDTQRDIQMRMADELAEMGLEDVHVSYHLTSIYDNTIFEAFSKVIQKLIPQLPTLENLLNILCSNSGIEKAFLFDVASKIYIATDSSPVDVQSYEICSDMIDVVLDIANIYGYPYLSMTDEFQGSAQHAPGTYVANPFSAISAQSASGGIPAADNTTFASADAANTGAPRDGSGDVRKKDAYSIIKLNNGMVLYLRQMNRYLALVSLIRSENFEKLGLIEYNFRCFNEALNDIFRLRVPQAATQEGM